MLEGKIALVTGASRGIGRQIAKTLAAKGAAVIVNYNGSAAKAEETVREIREAGGSAEAIQCNVSDFNSSKEMLDGIVAKYGRLDILVNNAGITRDNLVMKMSEEDFDAVIQTNLKGVFNCIHHIFPSDVKTESRTHYQYFLCFRRSWKCGTGQLLRRQGGGDRPDKKRGKRTCKPRHYRKRGCSGLYPNRYDRCAEG